MDPPLPPGWSAARDPASGRTYYYEHTYTTDSLDAARAARACSGGGAATGRGEERRSGGPRVPRPAPAAAAAAAALRARAHRRQARRRARRTRRSGDPRRRADAQAPPQHGLHLRDRAGASGANFCYELTECLRRLGHATEVERWHGAYSKDIKRNADRLERFAKEAAAASGEGCRVLLVGDGYGGRVVAHLLARWAATASRRPRTSSRTRRCSWATSSTARRRLGTAATIASRCCRPCRRRRGCSS